MLLYISINEYTFPVGFSTSPEMVAQLDFADPLEVMMGVQVQLVISIATFDGYCYPLVNVNIAMENGPFIVDFPMKHGDFP